MAQLKEVIDGCTREEEIRKCERRVRDLQSATLYETYERESDVAFEQGCLGISEQMHKDAKKMSVKEYYAAMRTLTERSKELEKLKHKHKR